MTTRVSTIIDCAGYCTGKDYIFPGLSGIKLTVHNLSLLGELAGVRYSYSTGWTVIFKLDLLSITDNTPLHFTSKLTLETKQIFIQMLYLGRSMYISNEEKIILVQLSCRK